jgi:hypothetical protein
MISRLINYGAIIFLVFGVFLPRTAFGIGQVTKPIVIEDALRGQEIIDTLRLSNSEEEEVVFGLKTEGDISAWTSFFLVEDESYENPITEFNVPPGPFFSVKVKFSIPDDIPNGEYKGKIYVFYAPTNESEGMDISMNVSQRIGREVRINVTDKEIIKFTTSIIPMSYQIDAEHPVQIKIVHKNLGNVSVNPSIQLKITREEKVVYNAIFPYPEEEAPIKPGENKVMPSYIEWETREQEEGNYRADIFAMQGDEVMDSSKFGFVIGDIDNAKAEYEKNKESSTISTFLSNTKFLLIFAIAVILIFLFRPFFIKKNNSKKDKNKSDATINLRKK